MIRTSLAAAVFLATATGALQAQEPSGGTGWNVLWIISDDHGPDLGCYGTPGVVSPNIDRLAREGIRFTNAHATAPICSPSRSALMTGMHQVSIGAHHHRSNRDRPLSEPVVPVTYLFRDAGWFTANDNGGGIAGKTDVNFAAEDLFDGISWRERAEGQRFFAQVNFFPPHRPFVKAQNHPTDRDAVVLPPYVPDTEELREDRAQYLDSIRLLDHGVGSVLARLEEDGLMDSTVIFFFGDNGRPFARDKQFLYDGGTHVPLIVRFPDGRNAGEVREDLVSLIDVTAQSLVLAGIEIPEWMEGRSFLENTTTKRDYLFTARDRADETVDTIRCVRTAEFSYIRNFMPERPYLQANGYKEAFYADWRALKAEAEAMEDAPRFLFLSPTKPPEELYDLRNDPHELKNLADDPEHAERLVEMRRVLDWRMQHPFDHGFFREDPDIVRAIAEEMKDGMGHWGPENPIPWDDPEP
jgi:N-sulfoglucosamine sulfohydrolase